MTKNKTPSVANSRFRYAVEYDIDGHNPGCVGCGRHYDGSPLESGDDYSWDYCRCYTIDSVTITSVSESCIIDAVCREFGVKKTDVLAPYGVSRILSAHGFFDKENYEATWSGNYYGEEVDEVNFTGSVNEVDAELRQFLELSTFAEQMEFLLEAEYGHVLEHLKDRKWEVASVPKKTLVLGAMHHASTLDHSIVESYNDWNCLIHAICIKEDDEHYRVIDGYHRVTSLLKSKKRKAQIIYAV